MRDAHEARISQLKAIALDDPVQIEALVAESENSLQHMEATLAIVAKAFPPSLRLDWEQRGSAIQLWIREERAIMALSRELARDLNRRNRYRNASEQTFIPFRASLDTLGEQVDTQVLQATTPEALAAVARSISLVLNADRDAYQALMGEQRLVLRIETDHDLYEHLRQDYQDNMDQIQQRLAQAQQLLPPAEALGFEVVLALYRKWRADSMQCVAINDEILGKLRQRATHEAASTRNFRDSQLWLAQVHSQLKQSAVAELASFETARDKAVHTSNQIRRKADTYLAVFNALAALAFICFLLLIVFQRRLVANLLSLSRYLKLLDEERLAIPYVGPKQTLLPTRDLDDLAASLNAMRERLVDIIAAHRTAMQWLTASEARYSNLFHNSVSPTLLVEPATGRIVDANQAAAKLYAAELAQLRLSTLAQFDASQGEDLLAPRIASLGPVQSLSFTTVQRRADGSFFSAEISAGIVADDKESHALVVINDVSERLEFERQLMLAKEGAESANRAKDQFLSVMSHELRTPLNPIIGYAQLLEQTTDGPTIRQFSAAIFASANRMLGIVESILYFSQLTQSRAELHSERFTIAEFLLEPQALAAIQPHPARITFHNGDPARQIPPLPLDSPYYAPRSAITQTLMNLLGNAFKYAAAAPIQIVFGQAANSTPKHPVLFFEVRDQGPGVPQDFEAALFQPFTQADASYTRAFEGIGLGLAICRKLVEQMGGQIDFRPNFPSGAIFTFTVPAKHALPEPRQTTDPVPLAKSSPKPSSRKPCVLVVEDNAENAAYLAYALRKIGAEPTRAASGPEALAHAANQDFDLALIDISMKGMDGFATFDALQNIPRFAQSAACIAVTAHAGEAMRNACLAKGFADFLPKPVSPSDLEQALDRALNNA